MIKGYYKIPENGKRGYDRLDTECLVSSPKRKEDFYSKTLSKEKQGENKSKIIQEHGESISYEADSGFETQSSSISDSVSSEVNHKSILEKPVSLRRSPRHALASGRNVDNTLEIDNNSYLTHSSSLDAIPRSPIQYVLTRSKSLRLSDESNRSNYLKSPIISKQHMPENLDVLDKSLISKFDSSLLSDRKTSEIEENLYQNFDIQSTKIEKEANRSSINVIHDEESAKETKIRDVNIKKSSYSVRRDIHSFSSYGKPHYNESRTRRCKSQSNRIVYCPGLFHGRERMDILRRLNDMNATHIINNILTAISPEDLGRSLQVSNFTIITFDLGCAPLIYITKFLKLNNYLFLFPRYLKHGIS